MDLKEFIRTISESHTRINFDENLSEMSTILSYSVENTNDIINFILSTKILFKTSAKIFLTNTNPFNLSLNYDQIDSDQIKVRVEDYLVKVIASGYKNLECKITIDKEKFVSYMMRTDLVERFNFIVFFSKESFINKLKESSFSDLEHNILTRTKHTIVWILSEHIKLDNHITLIIGGEELTEIQRYIDNIFSKQLVEFDWKNKINLREEICHWTNATDWLTPCMLYYNFTDEDNTYTLDLKQTLSEITINLIIPFIANYTAQYDNSGTYYSIINGNKKVTIDYTKSIYDSDSINNLYNLYKWVYESNHVDKIAVVRNTMSLFLCEECKNTSYQLLLNRSREIYDSSKQIFDNYINKKVIEFLKEQHGIREVLTNKAKDITNQISAIIETMNKSFLTSIGIIIASIIGYISKSNIYILKVSFLAYSVFILINAIFYIPYYKMCVEGIMNDFQEHIDTYKKTLGEDGIPDIKPVTNARDRFNKYWRGLIIINVAIVLISLVIVFFTTQSIYWFKKIL